MKSSPHRSSLPWVNRAALIRLMVLFGLIAIAVIGIWLSMFQMPGRSYSGDLATLSASDIELRDRLKADVTMLSQTIGPRNYSALSNLQSAQNYLTQRFEEYGYHVTEQSYTSDEGDRYVNLAVEKRGTEKPDEIIVIGGHYDSAFNSPGANDNGTGAAATLELSRLLSQTPTKRTVRFVEFANEEPPFFWTHQMGSYIYADAMKNNDEKVVAMLSLETLGYYSEKTNSQLYPFPLNLLYPNRGNFVGLIGNVGSGYLVRDAIASFRHHAQMPSEGVALPAWIPGVGWSDQWSFWQQGYPGIMVTDTATYRYPHYHTEHDTVDQIEFDQLAHVVSVLSQVIPDLANSH